MTDELPARGATSSSMAVAGLIILCVVAFWVGMLIHRTRKTGPQIPRGPELWLTFPDISDGDCMLIRDPTTDHNVLIDAGGGAQSAQQILACARQNGITHLDGIILLSARSRSMGGVPYLLGQIPLDGPVLLPDDIDTLSRSESEAARSMMSALNDQHVKAWAYNHSGTRAQRVFGDGSLARLQFLPIPTVAGAASSDPSSDLALRIDYGAESALDAAALEPSEEDRLLAGDPDDLACDVLVVADGGGAQSASSEFLALAAPRVATITNSADHPPADDTLASLQAAGAQVGQTHVLSSFTLRVGHYSEEPILWSVSSKTPSSQTPSSQTASSP